MRIKPTLELLRAYESPNITYMDPDGSWPIVWRRAKGVRVWDTSGRKYLDLTAAFGVAAAGHANPAVVRAGQRQMAKLLHAMGDVHPHELKARLARELSRLTFGRWSGIEAASKRERGKRRVTNAGPQFSSGHPQRGKTIFCNSGFEAVEAALKTALLATGKRGVIAFEGAYHGLGYGALNTTHREHFRSPFLTQLGQFGHFVPFPSVEEGSALTKPTAEAGKENTGKQMRTVESALRRLFRRKEIGAILVEPVQVRGGINIPAPGLLRLLREMCDEYGALLILDEIYTGFGRTGKWFACEHWGVTPDIICLGKALTGGFPLSACVGRAEVMDGAWPPSSGEAIHTSTFLGHPVGCAMALAQIGEIGRHKLVSRSAGSGQFLLKALKETGTDRRERVGRGGRDELRCLARGLGLLAGVELRREDGTPATEESLGIIKDLLRQAFIVLPEGEHANVISFTPPLTISESDLRRAVDALKRALDQV